MYIIDVYPGSRPRPAPHQRGPHRRAPQWRSSGFRSGNSQAVRMPAALRLDCRQVIIRREGAALIIEPLGADGWPAGYFDAIEAGSSLLRAPRPKLPGIRQLDAKR